MNIRTTTVTISVVIAMVLVTWVLLVPPYNYAMAYISGGSHHGVEVGDTQSLTVVGADNSQHCAFGAGSTADTCTNTPTNTQGQTTNIGSVAAGGGNVGGASVGQTHVDSKQKADNSQHCAFGAGSAGDTCTNTPTNTQSQTTNSGRVAAGG